MKCPVCHATYRRLAIGEDSSTSSLSSPICRRCGVDLSPLINLHDQAVWHHKQAIQSFKAEDYQAATTSNNQALALYSNHADFLALAGQLWALQGEFEQAISAWKKAQQFNPQHTTAIHCLQSFKDLAERPTKPDDLGSH